MKAVINCLVLLFFSHQLVAQPDSADRQFIHSQIRKYQRHGTIYYADRPLEGVLKLHVKELSKPVIKSIIGFHSTDSIVLTAAERRFLIRQLKRSLTTALNDNLFPISKRIAVDDISAFVSARNRKIIDSLRAMGAAARDSFFISNSIHEAFFFTMPIYIRDRSIFLHFFMWNTISGGAVNLSFYRKENDKWVKWIEVSGGDF
ncbi:hypothetical protein D3H65_30000 [Paraflavitalea soli]|uniref:DUF4294 domain-containing protein n=1 Tax=Paraflavitalea soli TaxID=2315862 RepID=A0A3B7MXL7_9BACT|nr:hypothetical protein [Paraflavitalea soli]AXY77969.1 hypothetical protein D3H65_30000 [Paraflavitalea soli]